MTGHPLELMLCNAGSTSLKVSEGSTSSPDMQHSSLGDNITGAQFRDFLKERKHPADIVLHRIVHAGAVEEKPRRLTPKLLGQIRHWQSLAPLHNGLALDLIHSVQKSWPGCEQFAVFDSGLFAGLPPVAQRYAMPATLSPRWPVKRYGFHGLAHRSQMRQLQAQGNYSRVITLQLGGGSSATAWLDGAVLDTSMGFTPMEGPPMDSRSGTIDPGILLHLLRNEGHSAASLDRLLNEKSGLKALAQGSGDMRELLLSDTEAAQFAIAFYCYQLKKLIGSYAAIMGGLDAITIGGGIGENQPRIRSLIFCGLEFLSLSLDQSVNASAEGVCALHESGSTAIWLTPVDEANEMWWQFTHFRHLHSL